MKGPVSRRERACIGAVLLSSSKEPTEYFFCKDPIDCSSQAKNYRSCLSFPFRNPRNKMEVHLLFRSCHLNPIKLIINISCIMHILEY